MIPSNSLQWLLVIFSSLALFAVSPWANTAEEFFFGRKRTRVPGTAVLTASLVISWLFAKSITNAANLGLSFGLVGGIAYAGYYLSFTVAGLLIYKLRTVGGFASIHEFLRSRFGQGAVAVFTLLISLRLFNEVWSNTMVIGSYFGDYGSIPYFTAVLLFTVLTLAYALKGGMAASLLTDVIQFVLFGVLLAVLLWAILPGLIDIGSATAYVTKPTDDTSLPLWGSWTLSGGVDLLLVAVLQSLSYPFHDPVLTDRGFVGSPKSTRAAYLWAGPVGAAGIILFSLVGVYGRANGVEGEAAVGVAKLFGTALMLVINLIMITSAASTLDSTLASWSKLAVLDLRQFSVFSFRFSVAGREVPDRPTRHASKANGTELKTENLQLKTDKVTVSRGRKAMIALTVLGTIPVFLGPAILSATTVSGLMVVGLAPVFLFWRKPAPALSFYLAVAVGLIFGLGYAFDYTFGLPPVGSGSYGALLSATIVATALACLGYLIPRALHPSYT